MLLRTVFGVENPEMYIDFERHSGAGFIDGYISATKVMIEQKSSDKDLAAPARQAEDYAHERDDDHRHDQKLYQREAPDSAGARRVADVGRRTPDARSRTFRRKTFHF